MSEFETPEVNSAPQEQSINSTPSAAYTYAAPAPSKKNSKAGIIAAILCCSLLSGVVGAGAVLLVQKCGSSEPEAVQSSDVTHMLLSSRETSRIETVSYDSSKLLSAAEVYAANVNSTVGITTSITTTNYWGYTSQSAASGSGFIISDTGYILTNYHVIEDSSSIKVALYDGTTYDATLIGCDSSNDIAVLKIDAEGLTPVVIGDSDSVNVGDSVVAIGNPLGELTFSLTSGAISAKDREVTLSSNVTMALLQTDCAINSGNSGGALFNMYGEVIGVTNAKYSGNSGSGASIDNIGFAIPVNKIMPIVTDIIEKGYITRPYIGVSVYDVSEEATTYGVPAGIGIQTVTDDSPAATAGLAAGDVITAVNGESMTRDGLVSYVSGCKSGDELKLSIYRKGETLEITVIIGEQTKSALPETTETTTTVNGQQYSSQDDIEEFYRRFFGSGSSSYGYGGNGMFGNR